MVLDPIPQSLPVPFFGSRPQPPTSPVDKCNKADFRGMAGGIGRLVLIELHVGLWLCVREWF